MAKRKYTIGYVPANNYDTPCIKITGKWLKACGFNIGDKLEMLQSKNMIILTKSKVKTN